jgi:DNA gyrase/topoisomerase IV subunit B
MIKQKTVEEKYQELSELQHILLRPGMWIGSTQVEESDRFVYNSEMGKMEQRTISYVPAMLKLFDEILSNSCDEYRRPDNLGLNKIDVIVNKETNYIEIVDNGGMPIVKHKSAGVYIPEFVFGRLRTSSNYDDSEDRNVVGTNGVGSSITNCFSTLYKVSSADGKNKLTCSWHDNMQASNDTTVEKCKKTEHFTKTGFILDLKRFGVSELSDDFISIIYKRCIDAAAANPGLKVTFNNDEWKFKNFDEYLDLYSDYLNVEDKIKFKNSLCEAYIFPDSSCDIGFVNGAECSKGTHMRILRSQINSTISDYMSRKFKLKDLSPRSIENKYSVFMNINVSNPSYSSQTKEELTTQPELFSKDETKKWSVDDRFLKSLERCEIVNLVKDWYAKKQIAEDEKTLRKLNKEAGKGLKRPDKYITCSSRKRGERMLYIFEGDSAKAAFRSCRNTEIQAGYTMRGVPMNCFDMTPVQIMKNEVFNDLVNIIGLKWGEAIDTANLNYGKIVIASDMDVDGDKICSLLLNFFNNWPELFENHIVVRSVSPIIIARKGKDCKKFYSMEEFKEIEQSLNGYTYKYTKGLGGLSNEESKEMYQQPIFMEFEKDTNADNMFRKWFNKVDSNTRKTMLSE